jgi:hypothetical protein
MYSYQENVPSPSGLRRRGVIAKFSAIWPELREALLADHLANRQGMLQDDPGLDPGNPGTSFSNAA